jgi:undecaprenyl diphosphate synthase
MENYAIPQHIAIIMDGNGRWAKKRFLPRYAGHKAGVETVRKIVKKCDKLGIKALTLFTFSSENWKRPQKEVGLLMNLFMAALRRETVELHKKNIRLRVIGDKTAFPEKLQNYIYESEQMTKDNDGLNVIFAANYGGQWDITAATKKIATKVKNNELQIEDINPEVLQEHLCLADLPLPDLFIRTGGEQRISNFLLWQMAYSELYFTDIFWPSFNDDALQLALNSYASRQRRFGQTSEQVEKHA